MLSILIDKFVPPSFPFFKKEKKTSVRSFWETVVFSVSECTISPVFFPHSSFRKTNWQKSSSFECVNRNSDSSECWTILPFAKIKYKDGIPPPSRRLHRNGVKRALSERVMAFWFGQCCYTASAVSKPSHPFPPFSPFLVRFKSRPSSACFAINPYKPLYRVSAIWIKIFFSVCWKRWVKETIINVTLCSDSLILSPILSLFFSST